jgi:alpha-L-rhamnosidase
MAASVALASDTANIERYLTGPLMRPLQVESTSGQVANAEALLAGREGYATLTWNGQGEAPMIILDYGRDVGGIPVFEVLNISGTPTLRAIYSEGRPFLLPNGDGAAPSGGGVVGGRVGNLSFVGNLGAGDLSRVNDYPLERPGLIVHRLIQGGQRWQALTLAAPGSVALRKVGIRSKTFHPRETTNRGSFACSDPNLSEIWELGAYTALLCQVPARSLPPTWTVTPQGVHVTGGTYSSYQAGGAWSDYTSTLQVKIVRNEASWLVRSSHSSGYRFVLGANNDALAGFAPSNTTPNTLFAFQQNTNNRLGFVELTSLGIDIKPGTWYTVKTVVSGQTVNAYLDDKLVLSFNVTDPKEQSSVGSLGLGNGSGAEALFRNLSVRSAGGQTLYASTLATESVLDEFSMGTNRVPSIIDGAKRDRYIWSGDIAPAGPLVYYTNAASEFIKGTMELFGSFHRPNGEVSTTLAPQLKPGLTAGENLPGGNPPGLNFWSTSYSSYFLPNLYDYYLYTGDLHFVHQQWPSAEKELAYLRSLTNAKGLLSINPANALDWHPQDNTVTPGVVAEYNVLYYHALRSAARLADALGKADEAAAFDAQAMQIKNAVNADLFNAEMGLYDISEDVRDIPSQDVNALAVLFGVAPLTKQASILQRLKDELHTENGPVAFSLEAPQYAAFPVISPFISGFEVWARFEAGDTAGALSLIRTVWGHMQKGSPYYSGGVWETLAPDATPKFGPGTSLAHPWSAGPTPGLSKYVLGVLPVEAGYKTWLIEPQPGDLTWAKGTVPTPYGPIVAKWTNAPRRFALEVNVPAGTRGTIGIPPLDGRVSIKVNGRHFKENKKNRKDKQVGDRDGYVYVTDLRPGNYSIVATAKSDRAPVSGATQPRSSSGQNTQTAAPVPGTPALMVSGGSGSGQHTAGTLVTVSADAPPAGQHFAGWSGDTEILANPSERTTTATMPSIDVTITATYSDPSSSEPSK